MTLILIEGDGFAEQAKELFAGLAVLRVHCDTILT